MRFHFIYNPRAGTARTPLAGPLQAFVARHGLDAVLSPTTHAGHATALARAAADSGTEVVVAVGGDGTVNEVARSLVGRSTALGLVPRGSGNGLARDLGVPLGLDAALAALLAVRVRVIDSGTANGHPFFCAMGAGFDSAVVRRFNALPRRGLGAYLAAALIELCVYRRQPIVIATADTPALTLRPLFVCVANAAQLGNGACIAPRARLDDGRLDLVAVPSLNPFIAAPLVWRLFRRTLDRSPRVRSLSGTAFTLRRPAPGPMHLDGELVEAAATIEVCVRAASLRVLAP